jgi:hypothetical protein
MSKNKEKYVRDGILYLETTKGVIAQLDLMDGDLAKKSWYSLNGYVIRKNEFRNYVQMHSVIMERILRRKLNKNEEVDHINGIRSDNKRENLRLVHHSENCSNIRKSSKTRLTCKYKGVHYDITKKKYRARITSKGVTHHLGFFDEAEDAAREYDRAAIIYFGQNAKLNFPWESYALETHRLAGSAMAEAI